LNAITDGNYDCSIVSNKVLLMKRNKLEIIHVYKHHSKKVHNSHFTEVYETDKNNTNVHYRTLEHFKGTFGATILFHT